MDFAKYLQSCSPSFIDSPSEISCFPTSGFSLGLYPQAFPFLSKDGYRQSSPLWHPSQIFIPFAVSPLLRSWNHTELDTTERRNNNTAQIRFTPDGATGDEKGWCGCPCYFSIQYSRSSLPPSANFSPTPHPRVRSKSRKEC